MTGAGRVLNYLIGAGHGTDPASYFLQPCLTARQLIIDASATTRPYGESLEMYLVDLVLPTAPVFVGLSSSGRCILNQPGAPAVPDLPSAMGSFRGRAHQ